MNNTELAWAIIATPEVAFAELRPRPRFWFPLAVLTISSVIVVAWYYAIVDLPWLMDHMLGSAQTLAQTPANQQAQQRAFAAMPRGVLLGSSVIGGVLSLAAIKALEALYYVLADRITNVQLTFKHWFAFANWTTMPSVIATISMAVLLATSSTNQIGNEELSLLSLNELFFHVPFGQPGSTLLSTLTVIHPWMWWLTAFGVRRWTGRSWGFSIVFAMLPVVLFYGGWAAFAFLR